MRCATPLVLLAFASLAASSAMADGAVAPREVDTRVLLDDEGFIDYGGCVEEQCAGALENEGLDLLSLDLREVRLADGRPALAFAVAFQWQEDGVDGRSVRLQFMAGGAEQVVLFESPDTQRPSVAGAARVIGPVPIGDGDPRMVEAWFDLAVIGLVPGSEVTEIRVQSFRGDTLDDAMPGGWYSNGIQMPHVPHSADVEEAVEEHPPGTYSMKGPSPLLDVSEPEPDSVAVPRAYTVTVRNPLSNLSQVVDARVRMGGVGHVTVDEGSFLLGPGESRVLGLSTTDLASGIANLTLASDLGAWRSFELPVVLPPLSSTTTSTAPASKDSPAPAFPLVLVALAVLVLVAWRRHP